MELAAQCSTADGFFKDHCNLDVLNSATLVQNTKQRFQEDEIYTCATPPCPSPHPLFVVWFPLRVRGGGQCWSLAR